MQRVVLHIGHIKTGTTWLQRLVFPAHPQIRYWLPQCDWIRNLVTDSDEKFSAVDYRNRICEEMELRSDEKLLISWESLAGDVFRGGEDSERNACRLASVFPTARVIICLREQLAMLDSAYRQYLHEGGTAEFEVFLQGDAPQTKFDANFFCYHSLVETYTKLFGKDRVHLCLYEDLATDPNSFLSALWNFLELDDASLDASILSRKVNAGMPKVLYRIQRIANQLLYSKEFNPTPVVPKWIISARRVRKVFQSKVVTAALKRSAYGEQNQFATLETVPMADSFRQSNQIMQQEYGIDLASRNYLT